MTTLAEFVLARIAEREAVAQAASTGNPWIAYVHDCDVHIGGDPEGPHVALVGRESWPGVPEQGHHIALNDPARVLAECERDQRLVALHTGVHECPDVDSNCGWWTPGEPDVEDTPGLDCPTLRLLASPHAAHPEFREEWKL